MITSLYNFQLILIKSELRTSNKIETLKKSHTQWLILLNFVFPQTQISAFQVLNVTSLFSIEVKAKWQFAKI